MEESLECAEATIYLPDGRILRYRPGLKEQPKTVTLLEAGLLEVDWGSKNVRIFMNMPMELRLKDTRK